MNGSISLNSSSECLLFVCRKATEICMLVLYLAILLKVFIHFKSSLVESVGSAMPRNKPPSNKDILPSSFPVSLPFLVSLVKLL